MKLALLLFPLPYKKMEFTMIRLFVQGWTFPLESDG